MKKLLVVFTGILILTQLSFSQKKMTVTQKFFEVDQDIESLRKEQADIRKQMREMEIRVSVPEIRKEINNLIQLPEMTHEIILNNGTVVKGKIIHEDMDRVVIQTQIGQLTLSKSSIKLTRKADLPKAKCVVDGAVEEQVHENKRVFKGKIKNEGVRRADFPRIVFYLYDEGTNLLAADSTLIAGNYHMYKSGVQTDATIEPGSSFNFECTVELPEDAEVSYYIKKIRWEEFE